MKKFLELSGFCALALAVVVFVLMMATPAIVTKDADVICSGVETIFGGDFHLAPLALIAWIFVLLAILMVCVTVILPLVKKVKAVEKFAGLINIVACLFLVLAGLFMFLTLSSWKGANFGSLGDPSIGAGWVIGGILAFVAGAVLVLPAVMVLVKKK